MTLFQLGAVLFGLWMIYEIFIFAKKKVLNSAEAGFWLSLWLMFIVIALFPNLLLGITQILRFSRVFDLLVVGALMILTLLIFMSYFTQKQVKQRVEYLIKQLAIKEVRVPSKK